MGDECQDIGEYEWPPRYWSSTTCENNPNNVWNDTEWVYGVRFDWGLITFALKDTIVHDPTGCGSPDAQGWAYVIACRTIQPGDLD